MIFFSSLISNQIRFLLLNVGESNSDGVIHDLCQVVEYGCDVSILLLQTCLDYMNCYEGDLNSKQLKPDLLAEIFRFLLARPNCGTVFCEAWRSMPNDENFLGNFCSILQLSVPEKISLGLALAESEALVIRTNGQNFCMRQIENLCGSPVSIPSVEQIQNIILFLYRSESLVKYVDMFMQMLCLVEQKVMDHYILTPFISDELKDAKHSRNSDLSNGFQEIDFDSILAEMETETNMADIMRELGYACTLSSSHCKDVLSLLSPLNEASLSRILGMVARTHTGLEDSHNSYSTFCSAIGISYSPGSSSLSSWNVDVLVDSIKQLAPETNWVLVMENMDHDGFYFPNEEAFSFFMSIHARVCKEPFPLHSICGSVWNNIEGQLSFLKYAVAAPADMFSFAHSVRILDDVDGLRGRGASHELLNGAWLSLDLLEVLCKLAEMGHAGTVRQLLEYPLKHCPEILLLGIAQINTVYNLIQNELSSTIFHLVVESDMAVNIIFRIWNSNPKLVLHGFIHMSMTDQGNLFKILNISQGVKILVSVLERTPFPLSIRLAVLAAQKEYINLEKWLNDNLTTYEDMFFEECLKFLKEACSDDKYDDTNSPFQLSGVARNIYSDSCQMFFKVLISRGEKFASPYKLEELKNLNAACPPENNRLEDPSSTDNQVSDGFSGDVETEANSFFYQLFFGQLTVDALIQKLAQFMESTDKREKSIYECMIHNLFEEYKFFNKYPEKQLKIAAVLLGSLIRRQLVTHLTLGIALRGVLDALRKPADSKIFVFGIKALEQFLERLVEWPQYCNHILQISHLHSAHPDIVSFIERALVSVSSGRSESSVGGSINDSVNSSTPSSIESIELLESRVVQSGQQPSTPLQLRQRQQSFIADRTKTDTSSTGSKLLNPFRHSPSVSSDLGGGSQKTAVSHVLKNGTPVTPVLSFVSPSTTTATTTTGFLNSTRGLSSSRQHSYNVGFGSALNIETLVAAAERRDTPVETPSPDAQDKILFLINNISSSNIEVKAKDFTEILTETHHPWFAQYMVMKRASIEPNFHDLYLKFLEKISSNSLIHEIIKATYENCKVLLRSELIKSSSEERSLLKNLGSWLGKFTIGRNHVLRARDIDPKSLIIEAYEKGLMIAIIPFTSKILEPCLGSIAYRPPNPWTMAILGLLAEIYALPNLKMNLKFDIEVLFKHLAVDLKDVKQTSLLKDRVRELEGNPDFSNKEIVVPQTHVASEINNTIISSLNQVDMQSDIVNQSHVGHMNVLSQYPAGLHLAPGIITEEEKLSALVLSDRGPSGQGLPQAPLSQSPYSSGQHPAPIPNIGNHIVLNQKLSALGLHYFHRVVPIAIERAIKEITMPVVQRSVAIASQTTKELVLKDYALESDETRIINAAHLMVASLAGSLAHVTCKEPLRNSISNQLRNSFQSLNVATELLEQAVPLIMNDNLDLGCAAIEHAATDKALQSIDNEIVQQLAIRRKHREGIGASYYEAAMYTQSPMGMIPEALRPRPGHLSHTQQRVYEDFVRFPWQNQPGQSSNAVPVCPPTSSGGSANSGVSHGYAPVQLNSSMYPSGGAVNQALDIVSEELDSSSSTQIIRSSIVDSAVKANSFLTEDVGGKAPSILVSSQIGHTTGFVSDGSLSMGDVLERFKSIYQKLEALITKKSGEAEIQGVISQIPEAISKCISRDEAALTVAQKVFKSLHDDISNELHVGVHLEILAAIRDVCKLVVKELTSWVIYSDEEGKYNTDIIVGLIQKDLLNLTEYNIHMAKLIDAGRNKAAAEFSVSLLQSLLTPESKVSVSDLPNIVDVLSKIASKPESPESLKQLVEIAKNPTAEAAVISGITISNDDRSRQSKDKMVIDISAPGKEDGSSCNPEGVDSVGIREEISVLFAEWFQIYEIHNTNDAAFTHYISQLHVVGFLNGDDLSDHFFRLFTELAVAHCLSSVPLSSTQASQDMSLFAIDVYSKLVVLILKYGMVEQGPNKILLPKILSVTVRLIQRDADEKGTAFQPRPYFRLFINWLYDLVSADSVFDGANLQVAMAFANSFHALQPLRVPGFSFAWIELVSHRSFMPKLLTVNAPKGWVFVHRLLIDLFNFMEPHLRSAELGFSMQHLYKGTLRVLLVLLHDFPEFLCDYHFSFCDVIPHNCVQLRNVILSAFPRNVRLPDPHAPKLKIDLLADTNTPPRILSEVDTALKLKHMKSEVDDFLLKQMRHQGSQFLSELKPKLMLQQNEAVKAGTRYDIPLINSLVLYIGMQTIQQIQAKNSTSGSTSAASSSSLAQQMESYSMGSCFEFFKTMIGEVDTEGRYIFLNAISNQLRYPNSHTQFFTFLLLFLFLESNQDMVQEQIARVLLERLIVRKPHPWGLLVTFIELIKNPRYNFWNKTFTRGDIEVERLLDSVLRSCGGAKVGGNEDPLLLLPPDSIH